MAYSAVVYKAWLEDVTNISSRVLAVNLISPDSTQVLRFATMPYFDGANVWDDWIITPPYIDESLDSPAFGSLQIIDMLGDGLGGKYPNGWTWSLYYGDLAWPLSDFRYLGSGLVSEVSRSGNVWDFALAASTSRLDKPVLTDENSVVSLGYCMGMQPILTDANTLTYRIHTSAYDYVTVMDRGVALSTVTQNTTMGTFKLATMPAGKVHCDVLVNATMQLQQAINALATMAGYLLAPTYIGLSAAQLAYMVGMPIYAGTTYREAMEFLAGSVGAYVVDSPDGGLRVVRLSTATIAATLTADEIIDGSVSQVGVLPALDYIALGWAKQWSPLTPSEVAGAALSNLNTLTRSERTLSSAITANNGSHYRDERISTALYNQSHTQAELNSIKTRRTSDRRIYSLQLHDTASLLSVGDAVTLQHDQIPFSTGNIQRIRRYETGLLSTLEILESA